MSIKIHKGGYAKCPCCSTTLPLRVCSATRTLRAKLWYPTEELLRGLAHKVTTAVAADRTYTAKVKGVEVKVQGIGLRCSVCGLAGPGGRSDFFWIDVNGALSEAICNRCLSSVLELMESREGVPADVPLYCLALGSVPGKVEPFIRLVGMAATGVDAKTMSSPIKAEVLF